MEKTNLGQFVCVMFCMMSHFMVIVLTIFSAEGLHTCGEIFNVTNRLHLRKRV